MPKFYLVERDVVALAVVPRPDGKVVCALQATGARVHLTFWRTGAHLEVDDKHTYGLRGVWHSSTTGMRLGVLTSTGTVWSPRYPLTKPNVLATTGRSGAALPARFGWMSSVMSTQSVLGNVGAYLVGFSTWHPQIFLDPAPPNSILVE